jgi:purine-nucleoside phosphorylase
MGVKVVGVSCVSNLACGLSPNPLSHEEVKETADRVAPLFKSLVAASIENMAGLL